MNKLMTGNRLIRHLLFWAFVILFFFLGEFQTSREILGPSYVLLYWVNFLVESLPTYLFFTYLLLYQVVPFFLRKQYVFTVLSFLILLLLTLLMQRVFLETDLYLVQPLVFNFQGTVPFSISVLVRDLFDISTWITLTYDFLLVGFVAAGIRIFSAWLRERNEGMRLEKEKLSAELRLIKGQIDAAFLFNTLDDLHQLTTNQSDEAPAMVLQLSALLSYILYESQAEEVPLARELEMVQNYLSLAEKNAAAVPEISLQLTGSPAGEKIAPLLLLPFVEYICKAEKGLEKSWASVDCRISDGTLTLTMIKGTLDSGKPQFEDVQKRLKNTYQGRYRLKIIPEEDVLIIKLTMLLDRQSNITLNQHHETELPVDR